jgi:hypothetical protein
MLDEHSGCFRIALSRDSQLLAAVEHILSFAMLKVQIVADPKQKIASRPELDCSSFVR